MDSFSFIRHRFHSAFELAGQMLPAMSKANVFYYNEKERSVLKIEWNGSEQIQSTVPPHSKVLIQKIRKNKTLTTWTNTKDLSFENGERKKLQYDISDEQENTVLLLKFLNPFDGHYDLIYLYLDPALSQFKMSTEHQTLSTENKDIIAKTMLEAIAFTLDQAAGNKQILNNIINAKKQEAEERNKLSSELDKLKKNYAKSILNFSLHHLDKISKESGVRFTLSEGASEKLMTYFGDFESLEGIIKNAASAAYNLSYDHSQITIDAGHLILYSYSKASEEHMKQRTDNKYAKSVIYLDRYEEAAQRLLLKDMAINGKNVAQFCIPAVSAAAITINIRAHRENIIILMDRHPDKWTVLREHFKPVQNILKDQHLGKVG